jgi:hypothetical protein
VSVSNTQANREVAALHYSALSVSVCTIVTLYKQARPWVQAFSRLRLNCISGQYKWEFVGRDSSVGTATGYGLGGPGTESR